MGSTKMKGLLKGLRYISQIFDEEKEAELKIGFPTDVKHVAHIGWDGPSVDSPTWMKEFKGPNPSQSQPLSANGEPSKEDSEIKWVSEDSCRKSIRTRNAAVNNASETPKSSRRHSDGSSMSESQTREPSTKPRHSKKNLADGSKPARQPKDPGTGSESSQQNPPDVPKKSRRKKSKEGVKDSEKKGSTRSSKSKAKGPIEYTAPYSDPGPGGEFVSYDPAKGGLCKSPSLKPGVKEGDLRGMC